MRIRLDIDKPSGKRPLLKGLWLQGFGWVVGGEYDGDITIEGEINLCDVSEDSPLPKIKRFLARVRGWYRDEGIWDVRGGRK